MDSTKPKPFAFILMPFDKSFDDIYSFGIRDACVENGAYCERVDEQLYEGTILERIYNQISKADFIIADMTSRNPNVFYEVGYAHALGKRTILLTQNSDDIPFDLKHYPHIIYENKIIKLKEELSPRIKWLIENPEIADKEVNIGIELYCDEYNLSSSNAVYKPKPGLVATPKITIQNASIMTYAPGEFQIGIITSSKYNITRTKEVTTTKLPDGNYLHMLPFFDTLFPGAFTSYNVTFSTAPDLNEKDILTFRVYTVSGSRDYKLTMQK
jgi:hypothetical protein